MDSYYALGATSVPMRKSRLVTAIRFSMCLHYNRSWKWKQATQPKHFHIFSTNSKFSQSFTIYYNFFTTYSFPPFSLYTFPTSEKTEAVKGKRKKYCRHITKRADLSGRFLCVTDRLYKFSAILFPPWRGRVFLITSTFTRKNLTKALIKLNEKTNEKNWTFFIHMI